MIEIHHLLIATDGSELSDKAAEFGGVLARACGARISLAIVHDERLVIPEAWEGVGLQLSDSSTAVSTEDVRRRIEDSARVNELAKSVEAIGELATGPEIVNLWGQPADQLCSYAANHAVDLIVIGSHGRSGIKRAILGSVSHAVVNSAPCAVTIVR